MTTVTEKHESMTESIEAVPSITKTLTPAAPCPPCTNRPHRTAPCRAVPHRAVPPLPPTAPTPAQGFEPRIS